MQVTEDEKFIFQEKEFLSELYRNCPEEPELAALLRNGQKNEKYFARKWIIFEDDFNGELQFADIAELSGEEYGEICRRRREAD